MRDGGEGAAVAALVALRKFGVRTRDRMDTSLCRDAARIKARLQHISLADCACVALARENSATVLTADRIEFRPIREQRICRLEFSR